MFGMSFSEIAIIAIVALVILGPEKLPEVARTAGKFMRQLRNASNMFRDTIMLEADLYEDRLNKQKAAKKKPAAAASAAREELDDAPASRPHATPPAEPFDYDGPLDQLDEHYFDLDHHAAYHDPAKEEVPLEHRQMSDPFITTEVALQPGEPDHAIEVLLVERHDVPLPAPQVRS